MTKADLEARVEELEKELATAKTKMRCIASDVDVNALAENCALAKSRALVCPIIRARRIHAPQA